MAFRVKDAKAAHERALELGATDVESDVGPMASSTSRRSRASAARALYLVDRYGDDGTIYDVDFDFHPDWREREAEPRLAASPTSTTSPTT